MLKKIKNARIKKSMKKHERNMPSGNIAKSIIDLAVTMNSSSQYVSITNTEKFSDKAM